MVIFFDNYIYIIYIYQKELIMIIITIPVQQIGIDREKLITIEKNYYKS